MGGDPQKWEGEWEGDGQRKESGKGCVIKQAPMADHYGFILLRAPVGFSGSGQRRKGAHTPTLSVNG